MQRKKKKFVWGVGGKRCKKNWLRGVRAIAGPSLGPHRGWGWGGSYPPGYPLPGLTRPDTLPRTVSLRAWAGAIA
jgi:hypothetical protein